MEAQMEPSVVVFEGRSEHACAELGLVLAARGIRHDWGWVGRSCQLRVGAPDAERAAAEIAQYRAENTGRAVGRQPLEQIGVGWYGVMGYAALLMLLAIALNQSVLGRDWLAAGGLVAGGVMAGELWRTVTALTLHLEFGHLAGNLFFGAFFGHFASRYLGTGVAWAAILASGALGNLLNAAVQAPTHRAIGASTAVFGALGLLAAYTWRRGFLEGTPWKERIAPVVAGIALLAFTGTGGENTDVFAHLTGFVCGFGIGVLLARVRIPRDVGVQRLYGVAALSVVALAWIWGLAAGG
jgi:rhomboid protease GluP